MPRTGWSTSTIPYGADQTVYLVIDRFKNGAVYSEIEIERTDLETIINDFITGQFNDPVRVVAFNTLEHWADDVSKDVAQEIQTRCDIAGEPVPGHIQDFVDTYAGPTRSFRCDFREGPQSACKGIGSCERGFAEGTCICCSVRIPQSRQPRCFSEPRC